MFDSLPSRSPVSLKAWLALLFSLITFGCMVYILGYWFSHPALTEMQVFVSFWAIELLSLFCFTIAGILWDAAKDDDK